MRTQCPHCQAYFNIKPEYVGKRTKCKNCGQGYLIAEATEVAAAPSRPSPAKITRFAAVPVPVQVEPGDNSSGSLPKPAAEKAEAAPKLQSAAAEMTVLAEANIRVEEPTEGAEVKAEAEEPAADQSQAAKAEERPEEKAAEPELANAAETANAVEVSSEIESANASEAGPEPEPAEGAEVKAEAEEPAADQSQAAKAEEGPEEKAAEPEPANVAEDASAAEAIPAPEVNNDLGLRQRPAVALPPLPKPPAVQAQIYEALKSSRPQAQPGLVAAAVPAFQPVSAAQSAAYASPGSEWAAAPSSYPASFQMAGAGAGYEAGSQFPAGSPAYPVPPQAAGPASAWGTGTPKNGQAEAAAFAAAGAVSAPGSAVGQSPPPNWPRNGGGAGPSNGGAAAMGQAAAYGRPAPGRTRPEPAPSVQADDDDDTDNLVVKLLKKVPLAIWITMALAFILGGAAGLKIKELNGRAEILGLQAAVAQAQQAAREQNDARVENLKKERQRLQADLSRVGAYSLDYPEGSIPRALAQAASEEFKIADTLLLQQITAIESGAKVTVSVKQTRPDPELAATLEAEMIKLEEEIARRWQEARELDETPKMLATTSIATQLVSLAILNRNLLIARYGLSSPVPLQYRSPELQNQAAPEPAPAAAPSGPASEGLDPQALAELERLKKENEQLRVENEMLLNSDSSLYASAVTDMGSGQLALAEKKFNRLLQMFPTSHLAPRANEGLAELKVRRAEKEAAKKPPLEITATGVKHDGGYFRNQTYVRVSFKNISQLMIKRVEFKVLTFDEHGYPIASKRLDITQDNFFNAAMTENIAPGRSDYGVWELSEKVRQVKVKLKAVEFYDAPPWRDEDIELWVEKEGGRNKADSAEAAKPAPAPARKAPAKRK